jgi:hypothetical protein
MSLSLERRRQRSSKPCVASTTRSIKTTEAQTAKTAKNDKDGDWDPQPQGSRFTRRMIIAEGPVVTK